MHPMVQDEISEGIEVAADEVLSWAWAARAAARTAKTSLLFMSMAEA